MVFFELPHGNHSVPWYITNMIIMAIMAAQFLFWAYKIIFVHILAPVCRTQRPHCLEPPRCSGAQVYSWSFCMCDRNTAGIKTADYGKIVQTGIQEPKISLLFLELPFWLDSKKKNTILWQRCVKDDLCWQTERITTPLTIAERIHGICLPDTASTFTHTHWKAVPEAVHSHCTLWTCHLVKTCRSVALHDCKHLKVNLTSWI